MNNEELIKQLTEQNRMLTQMLSQMNISMEQASLQTQLEQLRAELHAAKLEIQSLTEQREQLRHEVREREGQLRNLQIENARTLNAHELIFQRFEIDADEALREIEAMSGEDYYEQRRDEWYSGTMSNEDMRKKVVDFLHARDDYAHNVVDFQDKARMSLHTPEERVARAKQEHLNGGSVMREVQDGAFDFV